MRRGARGGNIVLFVLALVLAACSDTGAATGEPDSPPPAATPGSSTGSVASDECEVPAGTPLERGDSTELPVLGEVNGVTVSGALYPHPDYEGNPWSQWGQGLVAADGRFLSAIGDHLGVDGNSYLYEYDPATRRLTQIADILSYTDHVPGTWGYGKIHSQMVTGACGEIYFSTYWGTFREIEFEGNYTGDIIFRLDPVGDTLAPLGVPVEHHGQASMASSADHGLIYGEAVDPIRKSDGVDEGPFFAFDPDTGETVFEGPDQPHVGYRSVMVDALGRAYWSVGDGRLAVYDPDTGETSTSEERLPGDWMRAASAVSPDGYVYGVTREPDRFFSMSPGGDIKNLGDAAGYTASIALSPDGSEFYYLPGAHGTSWQSNSPLIAVDTSSGEQTTVVELNDLVEDETGYTVGGSYDVAVSPDGSTIFLGVNVGEVGTDSTFGEVMLLVIELP